MGNVVVVLILLIIAALSVRSAVKHYRGRGSCCGNCDNCKNSAQNRLCRPQPDVLSIETEAE